MKKGLLNYISCIHCRNSLKPEIFSEQDHEIFEGALVCNRCSVKYPVINFIPRMLPDEFKKDIIKYHPSFFRKYSLQFSDYLKNTAVVHLTKEDIAKQKTLRSFGYQWTVFDKMHDEFEMNFLNYIFPISRLFFGGKLGLDAGCGFGRHVYYAAQFGAEIIGMDLSEACEVAYKNTKKFSKVHIIQGDIYHPPFKENQFDFVYSIGVLHHLPSPRKGFESLLRFVKKNGAMFIWVYSKKRRVINAFLECFRSITNKIPFNALYQLCFLFSIIDWSFIGAYKLLSRNKIMQIILNPIIPARIKVYSQYPYQVCFADWFDRLSVPIRFYYSRKDMIRWFTENKLKNVIISPTGKYGWRAKGTK